MGTDIHMAVEVRKDGKWTWIPDAFTCPDCEGTGVEKYRGKEHKCFCTHHYRGTVDGKVHGFADRSYDTFGVLADVRNGTWGEPTPFISESRGLPKDIDQRLGQDPDREDGEEPAYGLGDHSFSYLTLAELQAFDWNQPLNRYAIITWRQFREWDKKTPPDSYCAGSSGTTVEQSRAEAFIVAGLPPPDNVRVKWNETIALACRRFHSKFLPELAALAQREGVTPDDVRIVFGFDS